jgi:hypothetical protein
MTGYVVHHSQSRQLPRQIGGAFQTLKTASGGHSRRRAAGRSWSLLTFSLFSATLKHDIAYN